MKKFLRHIGFSLFFALLFIVQISASDKKQSYQNTLSQRHLLRKKCEKLNPTQQAELLADYFAKVIAPFWYGTPWDFNGTTQEPGTGYIACGYFVTTVLRHAGYPLNRVKLAQCASETMIQALTEKRSHFSGKNFGQFIQFMRNAGKGLSVIGLDNHTGFIYHDGQQLWFTHSSFVGTARVCAEAAEDCSILKQSKYKVVGHLTQDPQFVKRWLNGI